MHSVGDIALNPSFRKSKREYSQHLLWYRINSSCQVFLSMYTFIMGVIDLPLPEEELALPVEE